MDGGKETPCTASVMTMCIAPWTWRHMMRHIHDDMECVNTTSTHASHHVVRHYDKPHAYGICGRKGRRRRRSREGEETEGGVCAIPPHQQPHGASMAHGCHMYGVWRTDTAQLTAAR